MVYIYDILLNFSEDLIEFFEWEDTDSIKYMKKVSLFKVSDEIINDIIYKNIVFSDQFISSIPKYEMNGLKDAGSACLFTNGFIAIGVLIKENKPILLSRLLLDEEREILDIANNMDITFINYKICGDKKLNKDNITRKERFIKEKLLIEINNLYKEKNFDKLFYLYYEYSGKESKNVKNIYNYLIKSLDNFNDKHKHLFDILSLSNVNLNKN